MDNRIKKFFIVLVVCFIIPCLSSCGKKLDLSNCVFKNVTNIEYTDLENIEPGAYWIESLEEYEALGLDKEYDKKFFKDNAILLVKAEWNTSVPVEYRVLLDKPEIENGVIYPVITDNIYSGMMSGHLFQITVMIAEVDKEYVKIPLGEVKK